MNYTRAIELTPVNFETIVKDTPFADKALLTTLHAQSPYMVVVKEPSGVFMIMTHSQITKFGFHNTTTNWFDVIVKR